MSTTDAEFTGRFFAVFKLDSTSPTFRQIAVRSKTGEETMDCLARVVDQTFLREALNVLHPQARKFFDPNEPWSVVYLELPQPISRELQKAVWQCPVDNWALEKLGPVLHEEGEDRFLRLRITDLRAFLFPTRIFII